MIISKIHNEEAPAKLLAPSVCQTPHRATSSESTSVDGAACNSASTGINEALRLAALHRTELMDTPHEEVFDRITRLATRLLRAPVALLSLVDDRRQFFKSATGLTGACASIRETPRSSSFCQHVVNRQKLLVVEDAREHPLMRNNPAIRELGVIAYLGVPVIAEGEQIIGSLCVNDSKPREWSEDDIRTMDELSEIITTEIQLRAKAREQEAALTALRESERRFRQMAENISQVFWMATPCGNTLIYISPGYEQIWGRTCASAYSNPGSRIDALVPEDRPAVIAAIEKCAAGEIFDIEYRIMLPDGTQRWICDHGFPVRDETGKILRVCGIAGDITARKRAEEKLNQAHRDLLDASRLAGMAEVATSVLHNVGNVLNSVNTSIIVSIEKVAQLKADSLGHISELLNKNAENLPAFFAEHPQGARLPKFLGQLARHFSSEQKAVLSELESLHGNLEHINEIVAMQQSYAGAGGVVEKLPLSDIIEDALRINAAAFDRHGTQVVREFDPNLPAMTIDRNKLLLILVNLVRNAKHACDEGARTDKLIVVRTHLVGSQYARIAVSDNGVGIPAENLMRIFAHGFTTRKHGHGFGLHSSALAASEMGGSLRVHSDGLGKGATFTIELPLHSKN
jgi:PAS domain S-box-containing protein